MPNKVTLGPHSIVTYNSTAYRVESLLGNKVKLKPLNAASQTVEVMNLAELISAEDFRVHAADDTDLSTPFDPYASMLDELPPALVEDAMVLQAHIREVTTGYRSGRKDEAAGDEPRPGYDPAQTNLTQRIQAKAKELDRTERTVWKLYDRYREQGVYGLVNKKKIPYRDPLLNAPPQLIEAIRTVAQADAERSTASLNRLRRRVERHLSSAGTPSPVAVPSQAKFNVIACGVLAGTGFLESARRVRSNASRPKRVYRPIHAVRQ